MGAKGCECLSEAEVKNFADPSKVLPNGSYVWHFQGHDYIYPKNFATSCFLWDNWLVERGGFDFDGCSKKKEWIPGICSAKWCYVNPCDCDLATHGSSFGDLLWFSYGTCCGGLEESSCTSDHFCAWSNDTSTCGISSTYETQTYLDVVCAMSTNQEGCASDPTCDWKDSRCVVASQAEKSSRIKAKCAKWESDKLNLMLL